MIRIGEKQKFITKGVQMMRAAIFTIDSGIYKAKAESAAASALKRMLEQVGFEVKAASVLPQEREVVAAVLRQLSDSGSVDLILTTGAVGYQSGDVRRRQYLMWRRCLFRESRKPSEHIT